MRSNRIATLAVVAGLALLGSVSAGVAGLTAGATRSLGTPTALHHPDHDGDHHGRGGEHRF